MKKQYFECICESSEHVLRLTKDEHDIYIEVQLNNRFNFFKRILLAIKYIFGYESEYGHWDCWILKNKIEAKLMINALEEYIKDDNI